MTSFSFIFEFFPTNVIMINQTVVCARERKKPVIFVCQDIFGVVRFLFFRIREFQTTDYGRQISGLTRNPRGFPQIRTT